MLGKCPHQDVGRPGTTHKLVAQPLPWHGHAVEHAARPCWAFGLLGNYLEPDLGAPAARRRVPLTPHAPPRSDAFSSSSATVARARTTVSILSVQRMGLSETWNRGRFRRPARPTFRVSRAWNDLTGCPDHSLAERNEEEYERRMNAFEERYWHSSERRVSHLPQGMLTVNGWRTRCRLSATDVWVTSSDASSLMSAQPELRRRPDATTRRCVL